MSAGQVLADLVLAPRCAGCGDPGSWFCLGCRELCDAVALAGALPVRGAGTYAGPLREAIHRLKYGGERGLAAELGALVAGEVAADLAGGVALDAIVPVVLHPSRAAARGYDQARLLAAAVAARTALPVRAAIHRIRASRPQVELDRAARAANVRRAFLAEAGALPGPRVAPPDGGAPAGPTLPDAPSAAPGPGGPPAPGPKDHVCSVFPPGMAILALPFFAPFVLSGAYPGDLGLLIRVGHVAAAFFEMLATLLLWSVIRRFTSARWSLVLVLLYFLATSVRTVSSQALWQHPGVHLAIASALWLTLHEDLVPLR